MYVLVALLCFVAYTRMELFADGNIIMSTFRSRAPIQLGPEPIESQLHIRNASRVRADRVLRSSRMDPSVISTPTPSRTGAKTIELWREFINSRYNAQMRFLNFEVDIFARSSIFLI